MMETFRRMGLTLVGCVLFQAMWAARILVPMDDSQSQEENQVSNTSSS